MIPGFFNPHVFYKGEMMPAEQARQQGYRTCHERLHAKGVSVYFNDDFIQLDRTSWNVRWNLPGLSDDPMQYDKIDIRNIPVELSKGIEVTGGFRVSHQDGEYGTELTVKVQEEKESLEITFLGDSHTRISIEECDLYIGELDSSRHLQVHVDSCGHKDDVRYPKCEVD